MKINMPIRLQNPWFWTGIVSVGLTAIGLDASTLTSWGAVMDAVMNVLSNPFQLATLALAVLAVFVDPTTEGLGDSEQALARKTPSKR